jgi:hypothetical protein
MEGAIEERSIKYGTCSIDDVGLQTGRQELSRKYNVVKLMLTNAKTMADEARHQNLYIPTTIPADPHCESSGT